MAVSLAKPVSFAKPRVDMRKFYVTETYESMRQSGRPFVVFSGTYRDCRAELVRKCQHERSLGYPIGLQTGEYASVNIGTSAKVKFAITDKYPHPTN